MAHAFEKTQNPDGTWQLDLDGIRLVVEGFEMRGGQHWLERAEEAVAYFLHEGNFYGISNNLMAHQTAEALYDDLRRQYQYFETELVGSALLN